MSSERPARRTRSTSNARPRAAASTCFMRASDLAFTREEFEAAAIDYLARHEDDVDVTLRADEIDIQAVAEGRGILRHHLDVPSVSRD